MFVDIHIQINGQVVDLSTISLYLIIIRRTF